LAGLQLADLQRSGVPAVDERAQRSPSVSPEQILLSI